MPIRWRTVRDILPAGAANEADTLALRDELLLYKPVAQAFRKQKKNGTWGDGILGPGVMRGATAKNVGTISQYRHLVELGVPNDQRAFRLADRVLFRLLSRDEDPSLFFEFAKTAKGSPEFTLWIRSLTRQAAAAALASAGHFDDPRVRGAAHRVASDISQFLRSEVAEKLFVRKGSRTVLHPDAIPPTIHAVATIAYMPSLQRERAGFVERLCTFLASPSPKRRYAILVGKRVVKPTTQLLGDPLLADSHGRPKDLALALYWIELLARLGSLNSSPMAQKILSRLLSECDANGVWNPGSLRGLPKGTSGLAEFVLPLEIDAKNPASRQADVTFRLALIAKLAGWTLEHV
ncbi:MAG: hypothetical protein EXR93_03930 [Gemmatimonadetes bacterium]|nr:hypothetical protein [Gemmatimonadota bacterium]